MRPTQNITHADIEQSTESTPETRLLSAVVGLAVKDSMQPPVQPTHKDASVRMTDDAMSAFDFLFTETSDVFLEWLDIDPPAFRKRLLAQMSDLSTKDKPFKQMDRRYFRMNHALWQEMFNKIGGPVSDFVHYELNHLD